MHSTLDRRRLLRATVALGTALALPRARACEFMTTTLRVTHPWTRASAVDASTAVLGMKFDEVSQSDRLVLVSTPVATGAEMGGLLQSPAVDFVIAEGSETYLDESGTFVRLLGLRFPLLTGRSYPLTLGFEKGGTYTTTLSVDYPSLRFG